jgi:hypothetical protein
MPSPTTRRFIPLLPAAGFNPITGGANQRYLPLAPLPGLRASVYMNVGAFLPPVP